MFIQKPNISIVTNNIIKYIRIIKKRNPIQIFHLISFLSSVKNIIMHNKLDQIYSSSININTEDISGFHPYYSIYFPYLNLCFLLMPDLKYNSINSIQSVYLEDLYLDIHLNLDYHSIILDTYYDLQYCNVCRLIDNPKFEIDNSKLIGYTIGSLSGLITLFDKYNTSISDLE